MRRRWGALVVVTLLTLPVLLTPGASADGTLYVISGTVTDGGGRGRAGIHVSDGERTLVTGPSGAFRFETSTPGVRLVSAWIPGNGQQTHVVVLAVPGETVVDFSFPYYVSLWGAGFHDPISTAGGPVERVLPIATDAPNPGSPGEAGHTCVSVADSRTGTTTEASFVGATWSGWYEWEAKFSLPGMTPEGTYEIDMVVADCASGARVTEAAEATRRYKVDNTPPEVSEPAPTGWVAPSTIVSARIVDAAGSMTPDIDWGCFRVSLSIDGERYFNPCFERGDDPERLEAPIGGLAHGPHVAEVRASDDAGNSAEPLTFGFTVDALAPAFTDSAPVGTIDDRSPTISVALVEPDSGVDASTLVMRLSNGVVTSEVDVEYDSATQRATYEVPDGVAGPGLGEFPLVDGTYDVSVQVADRVGNVSGTFSWEFEVRTAPAP